MRSDYLVGAWILAYMTLLGMTYLCLSPSDCFQYSTYIKISDVILPFQIIPEQVHVSFEDSNSAWITFSCKEKPKECLINYLDREIKIQEYTHKLHRNYVYKVKLENLPNSREIKYGILCSGGEFDSAKEYIFISHPGLSDDVSIIVLGDWSTSLVGDGSNYQHTLIPKPNVRSALLKETVDYNSIWQLGDLAYDLHTNNGERGDQFLNDLEPLIARKPYMPVVGNHEIFEIFKDLESRFSNPLFFEMPMGKAMIISISSEFEFYQMKPNFFPYDQSTFNHLKQKQLKWLGLALSKIDRNKFPWLIVMAHKPMYCSNNRWSAMIQKNCGIQAKVMRETFEDIFLQYKVDLFLTGHVHLYERMMPIKRGTFNKNLDKNDKVFINPDGIIHVINGVAGNLERKEVVMNVTDTPADYSVFMTESLGYGLLKIYNTSHLYYEQYAFGETQNDEIVENLYELKRLEDYFWIIKR